MKKIIKLYLFPILILCVILGVINFAEKSNIKEESKSMTYEPEVIYSQSQEQVLENEEEVIVEEPKEKVLVYTTASVNIRKTPGLDGEIFKTVPINTELKKIDEENNWSIITIDENKYYINSQFLSNEKTNVTSRSKVNYSSGSRSLGVYTLTAYCGCSVCCGKSTGITASGARATAKHTIAAPSNFSFGTKLSINGIIYTVEDRGRSNKRK